MNELKSRHAFGSEVNIESALASGAIDAYDILFLNEGKLCWIDRNGNIVIPEFNEKEIIDVEVLPEVGEPGKLFVCEGKLHLWNGEAFLPVVADIEEEVIASKIEEAMSNLSAQYEEVATAVEEVAAAYEELRNSMGDGATQADWNENDETSPAYVKNRPFYVASEANGKVIFDGTVEASIDNENGSYQAEPYYIPIEETFIIGESYVVIVNGEAYDVVCQNNYYPYLGAKNSSDLNVYPFSAYSQDNVNTGNVPAMSISFPTQGIHTVKIVHGTPEELVQIDEKFIPDSIARKSDMVELTAEDIRNIFAQS